MDDLKRCYEILGLTPGASEEELRQAYRDLIKVWHPDRFSHDPRLQHKAQEKLKEINAAYEKIRLAQSTQGQTFYEKTQYETSEKEAPPSSPPPPTDDKSGSDDAEVIKKPQPWVRYWARLLDMQIFLSISLIPIGFLSIPIVGFTSTNFLLMLLFIFLFSVFLEASVIAIFGNTPAKALLRTKIRDRKDKGLSFTEALKRSFYVAIVGNAFYLPLLCLVPWLWQYKKLTREGKTSWDNRFGFNVVHSRIGGLRITSYLILLVFLNAFTDKILPQIIATRPISYADCMKTYGKDTASPMAGRVISIACNNIVKENKTDYYDCIIKNMPGTSNDMAARAIIRDCQQKSANHEWVDITPSSEQKSANPQASPKTATSDLSHYSDDELKRIAGIKNNEFGKGNGKLSIFTEYEHGTTDVYVDGILMGQLNSYFPAGASDPACGQDGTVSKIFEAGSHRFHAQNSDGTYWETTINVREGECFVQRLQKTATDAKAANPPVPSPDLSSLPAPSTSRISQKLISQILKFEQEGHSPDEILAGLEASKKYPNVSQQIKAFREKGHTTDEIYQGLKASYIPPPSGKKSQNTNWEDILNEKDFQALPQEQKNIVAQNYFKANIEKEPEYQALPQESKTVVFNNFMATLKNDKVK